MPRRLSIAMVVIVVLACAGTTCLYSGAGPMDPQTAAAGGNWSPWLAAIADLLTVPIPTLGIADVRDVVLIFALGMMMLFVAAARWMGDEGPRGPGAKGSSEEEAASSSAGESFKAGPAMRWLLFCTFGVGILSAISMAVCDNSEFSAGWFVRFVLGAVWAMLIARFFTPQMTRAAILSLLAVAAAAILLAFARARDVGYAHISWPIGPITITAALAGCWAAIAVVWAAARLMTRRNLSDAIFAGVVLLAFIAALINTGRRSSAIGLIAALVIVGTVALIRAKPTRARITAGILAAIVAVSGGVAYVVREATNPDRVRSGPVQLRLTYLEKSWELIREHPFLGVGPDMFIVAMTNKIAPLRAVSPHVYHGGYDPTAHNEWVQAAVELGVPAAILYLALPLGVTILALRRARTTEDKLLIYPLAAGLIAICVTETASVTMRGPIMPAWYWTLVGLLCVSKPLSTSMGQANSNTAHTKSANSSVPARNLIQSISGVFWGLYCLWLGAGVMSIATSRTGAPNRQYHLLEMNLTFEKEFETRYRNAAFTTEIASRDISSHAAWRTSADAWGRLWQVFPVYSDVAEQYAHALIKSGDAEQARQVLDATLSPKQKPFNPVANALYASLRNDPAVYLDCLEHALRAGAFDEHIQSVFADHLGEFQSPANQELLQRARIVAAVSGDDEELSGTLVELLRVSAFVKGQSGDWPGAIEDQRLAAHCYRRLERESHPYRRAHEAETDAWCQLAAMLAQHQPENWREAFDAIRNAERYAVLGINHEDLADQHPDWGYVGGEVVPTEYPESLRPLWRLSALLQVVAGEDRFLDLRIFASLPPEKWTTDNLNHQLFELAREAYALLSKAPPETRPKHFDRLPAMAEYYGRLIRPPTSAPAAPGR